MIVKTITIFIAVSILTACQASPPSNKDNICDIFAEKKSWRKHAYKTQKKWQTPVPVLMAIMRYESGFRSNAKTPRKKILWVIPSFKRISSAKGYAQALDGTWKEYKRATGKTFVSRSNFADAIDFMGWYLDRSSRKIGISRRNAYQQYLAYHEGYAGYKRGTHHKKPWLKSYARKVSNLASLYTFQLGSCK